MSVFYELDGMKPVCASDSFAHPTATIIGDVIIGGGVYIGPGAALRGDLGRIIVGDNANVQDNCVLHGWPGLDTVIETEGQLGHGAIVHGATIRRGALIGMNAVILEKCVIGEFSVVAAGSVALSGFETPARVLAAGVPAKIKRELTDADLALKRRGASAYAELARRCIAGLKPTAPLRAVEPQRKRVQDIFPHLKDLNPK